MSDFSGHTTQPITEIIVNSDFWPAIDMGEFQDNYRIDAEYRLAAIKMQLIEAMQFVNQQLESEACEWVRMGYFSLADVRSSEIDNQHWHTQRYVRAVMTKAKAELLQEYRTMNRRDNATNNAKEAIETYDHLMAQSDVAINDLKGTYSGSALVGIHAL